MKTPVVVLGASGQVGLFSIARLLDSGTPVVAVKRDHPSRPDSGIDGLRVLGWQGLPGNLVESRASAEQSFSLLSCGPVGLARDLLIAGESISVAWNRVVLTGTTSINTKESSPDPEESAMIREIRAAIEEIGSICRKYELPLCVLSPTLIYGCGMDQNLSRVYRWIKKFGFAPIARQAGGLRQPLHVDDLATALTLAATALPAPELDSPVCGAGSVPYDEMVGLLFRAAQKRRRVLRVPDRVLPVLIAMYRLISGNSELNLEMFRRQSRDMVFDDSPARELLGHDPGPFDPGPEDFVLPEKIRRIRNALL